jgi:hypothetical protein
MSTLFGLKVQLGNRFCRCGYPIAIISAAAGEHYADLKCANCGALRGSLSERTANIIQAIADKFGAPTTPIILRR